MFTVMVFLLIAAMITTVAAGTGYCPLWVPVMLLCLMEALHILPAH